MSMDLREQQKKLPSVGIEGGQGSLVSPALSSQDLTLLSLKKFGEQSKHCLLIKL
jgi:hypothetical protein